jgi:hypothetical protein
VSTLATKPLSIGYFGASVTAQREGYRPRLDERLRVRFGQDHRSIFAGVGGIDVVSAVFLTDDLVTRHRPDLCLVEFTSTAVLGGSTLAEAEAAMDGILAKLTSAGTRPCLLHLPRREWRADHSEVLAALDRVADRCRTRSIDLTGPLLDRASAGVPVFRDEVHLAPAGADLAAQLIDEAIAPMLADESPAGELPDPLECGYRGAGLLPVAAEDAQGPASLRPYKMQRACLELPSGSEIRREFADRLAGLVLLVGPKSGEVEVSDRSGVQRVMTWDEWCHYERYTACRFGHPCEPGEVAIALTDSVPDYSLGRQPYEPPEARVMKVMGYMVLPE